jgi:hypothetical protein
MSTPIPHSLLDAYQDVIQHKAECDYLPLNPNEFHVLAHYQALDRACSNDIKWLTRHLDGSDGEDPNAVLFLQESLLAAKRLRMWCIEAFNAEPAQLDGRGDG